MSDGWCAPSKTLYSLEDTAAPDWAALFKPAQCPAEPPIGDGSCVLVDRLNRHGDGHRNEEGTRWDVTRRDRARWTHDCPRPDAAVAWAVLLAAGVEEPAGVGVPCGECGAVWYLSEPYSCGECGRSDPDDEPEWSRFPRLETGYEPKIREGSVTLRGGLMFPARKIGDGPDPEGMTFSLPLHRTEAGGCSTCDGGGCPDCTDPA